MKKDLIKKYFKKSSSNPIIEPDLSHSWERFQTFNPSSIYLDKKVHFLYRAIGESGLSVLGYAQSKNGIEISRRFKKPAFFIKNLSGKKRNLSYSSGGSISGCEDPRIVEINNIIYITYTAFSHWSFVRMGLSWIKKKDFLNQRWDRWRKPIFLSSPNEVNKNWVLFPEKINGKFAILHSISPEISIDYLDSFEDKFIESHYEPKPVGEGWELYRKGAGPPPIKTKKGWLLLYHAVDKKDSSKYKIGCMLLDLKDPSKILNVSKEPILEPDSSYENNGFKPGIVYSCGAVVIKGILHVYYGAADSVSCVATCPLNDLLDSLTKKKKPKFKIIKIIKKWLLQKE